LPAIIQHNKFRKWLPQPTANSCEFVEIGKVLLKCIIEGRVVAADLASVVYFYLVGELSTSVTTLEQMEEIIEEALMNVSSFGRV
jgi:hypothetical protein